MGGVYPNGGQAKGQRFHWDLKGFCAAPPLLWLHVEIAPSTHFLHPSSSTLSFAPPLIYFITVLLEKFQHRWICGSVQAEDVVTRGCCSWGLPGRFAGAPLLLCISKSSAYPTHSVYFAAKDECGRKA